MAEYKSKLKPVSIKYASRASIKIDDNFYTVGAEEERVIPENAKGVNWEKERQLLWDEVNGQIDDQVEEIKEMFRNN